MDLKISSKINIIKNLIPKFNSIILAAMANNILKYKGLKIGNSIYEKNIDYIIQEIFLYMPKKINVKYIFQKMLKLEKKLNDKSFEKDFKDIEEDDMILDVGSKTLIEIKRIIDDPRQYYGTDH